MSGTVKIEKFSGGSPFSYSLPVSWMSQTRVAAGVSSGVTGPIESRLRRVRVAEFNRAGGRSVLTSPTEAEVGEPLARRSLAQAGTGRGRLPPHAAAPEVTRPGDSERKKRSLQPLPPTFAPIAHNALMVISAVIG